MRHSPHVVATAVVAVLMAVLGLGIAFAGGSSGGAAAEAQARSVVGEFFDSLNTRQFEKACGLLSRQFYRRNRIPSRARCV